MSYASIRRWLVIIVLGSAAAVLGTYLAVFAYLLIARWDTVRNCAVLALGITWVLALRSACAGGLMAPVITTLQGGRSNFGRVAASVVAALAGIAVILSVVGNSPHVNSTIAAGLGGLAYAAIALAIVSRQKTHRRPTG